MIARIGDYVKRYRNHLWTVLWVGLAAWAGFNTGLLSARHGVVPAQESSLFRIRDTAVSQTPTPSGQGSVKPAQDHSDPRVVASKASSSKKYHYTWCSGGTTIKEANRIWFPTAQAAEAAGYTLAGNCTP